MTAEEEAKLLLGRFSEQAAEAMLSNGWTRAPHSDQPEPGVSQFLGDFQQTIAPGFVATVEFMLWSGPVVSATQLHPFKGVLRSEYISASVGGHLGLRHAATEKLLNELGTRCNADITLEIDDLLEDEGRELPVISDESSVDDTVAVLTDVIDRHALPFARSHASVEAMAQFVRSGGQTSRIESSEYLFVPALLAADGRKAEALQALATYGSRTRSDLDGFWRDEFEKFAQQLTAWLNQT
ncbi:MAG: hypothetical protein ACYC0H_21130 [Solirubrobacteraceae bacterium]